MITIGSSWDPLERVIETIENLKFLNECSHGNSLDLQNCDFIRPISITPLSSIALDKELEFYNRPWYLDRIGFPRGHSVVSEVGSGGTYVPLTRVDLVDISFEEKEFRLRQLTDFYVSLLERNIIADPEFLNRIGKNVTGLLISEMVDNIIEHSNAENAFICSQYWHQVDGCEICLVDNGVGIFHSLLSANRDVEDDMDALIKVINECLSAKDEFGRTKRGTGIRNTIRLLSNRELNGYFCVISGNAIYYHDIDRSQFISIRDYYWNGTIVNMGFYKPDNIFNIYDFIR